MAEARSGYRLVAAVLSASLMPLNSTMVAVAVGAISTEFEHDPALMTHALVTSYLIAAVVLQSPAGKIGDRVGHVRMVTIGHALVILGAVLGLLAPTPSWLIIGRILMAGGGAALVPAAVALLRNELPPERRGRAFGAMGTAMGLSAAVGPILGGALVDAFGWRSVFTANLPVVGVAILLGALAGRAPREKLATSARFDWVGAVLLATALSAAALGLRSEGRQAVVLLVVAAGVFIPFALWERRAADPVVAFSLFRSAHFSAGVVLIAMQNLVMYALLFEVTIIAETLFGLEARGTGGLLAVMTMAMVLTSPVGGRLADRWGARVLAVAGSASALAGVVVLAAIDLAVAEHMIVPLALLGVGIGLTTPAAQSASMTAVPAEQAGMAAGMGSTMRYFGGMVGVAVMAVVLDVHGPRSAVISDHRALMGWFAGALVIGLVCAVLLPGRTRTEVPDVQPAAPITP